MAATAAAKDRRAMVFRRPRGQRRMRGRRAVARFARQNHSSQNAAEICVLRRRLLLPPRFRVFQSLDFFFWRIRARTFLPSRLRRDSDVLLRRLRRLS